MTDALPHRVDGWALFLDFDGTLVDIAEMPDAVVVPGDLPALLTRVARKAGGALAVVSGRTIDTLDRLLAPAKFSAAGVHGAELRLPAGGRVTSAAPVSIDQARHAFADFATRYAGLLVEDKGVAVALHYRRAPEAAAAAVELAKTVAAASGGTMTVQLGKSVVELRPAGANKGHALAALMEHPPFRGRRPLAVGDDVTDEAMFAMARSLGGLTVSIGSRVPESAASVHLADPQSLRGWLAGLE